VSKPTKTSNTPSPDSQETPVDNTANEAAVTTPSASQPDLGSPHVREAITQGLALIKDGKSKADAARAMYSLLKQEDKDLIVAAFVAGATLTEKGALTYWYNCKRRASKSR
jgi:hypothetical protein